MNVTYTSTGALQYLTLAPGTFTITASGAAGGAGEGGLAGGLGAVAGGDFTFTLSTRLILVVGGAGGEIFSTGGGGGGSFVYVDVDNDNAITSNDILLLAAGGGGGAGNNQVGTGGYSAFDGSGSGLGGAGGSGPEYNGGGGAGIAGGGGKGPGSESGRGAPSITSGGTGHDGGDGGYGGGGGGGIDAGGGGGGYTGGVGGEGASSATGGGGGRSFIDSGATSQVSTAGARQGDGQVSITCYAAGTRILTTRGDIAVEDLAVGDRAVTASGEHRPIRWIGHRTYRCHERREALPVRIAAGAFGEGRPARDLFVSPAHALCVDLLGEVLIPAVRLVNGTTITQADVETVTYWHVELDGHDILLAEGMPAESYLDCGNRSFFANADVTDLAASPDARPEGPLPFCRPFHESGPLVDLVRARLRDRAEGLGWRKVEETFGGLHLVADGAVIRPDVAGLTARFVLPAEARDVRLVSAVSVPAHVVPGSTDERRLGVPVGGLAIDDGLTGLRAIAADDPRLSQGFHAFEERAGCRWTEGAAVLPAELWAGTRGTLFLRVTLSGPVLPRWIGPGEALGPCPIRLTRPVRA